MIVKTSRTFVSSSLTLDITEEKGNASIHLNDDTDYALERDDHHGEAALLRGRPHTVPAYYVSIVNVM